MRRLASASASDFSSSLGAGAGAGGLEAAGAGGGLGAAAAGASAAHAVESRSDEDKNDADVMAAPHVKRNERRGVENDKDDSVLQSISSRLLKSCCFLAYFLVDCAVVICCWILYHHF